MEIRQEKRDGTFVITPVGRVDSTTSGELEQQLLAPVAAGERRLVLDLAGVAYVSSAGLRVFLKLTKKLKEVDGALVLCTMGEPVRQVFELAGFLPLFAIEASLDLALARLRPGA
jgi:anti-anti-sigma factor